MTKETKQFFGIIIESNQFFTWDKATSVFSVKYTENKTLTKE
jgi:hypothetical protein